MGTLKIQTDCTCCNHTEVCKFKDEVTKDELDLMESFKNHTECLEVLYRCRYFSKMMGNVRSENRYA